MHAAPDLIFSERTFVIFFFQRHLHWVATVSNKLTFWVQQLQCLGEHLEEAYLISQNINADTNGLLCANESLF